MENVCLHVALNGERIYRLFLDILSIELDNLDITDITSFQTVVLINLGGNTLSIGELITRGYYTGSNASYNLKKMVANGYITQTISTQDKRSSNIKLSEKGLELHKRISTILNNHAAKFEAKIKDDAQVQMATSFLESLEQFLHETIRKKA
jgi:DNA-binding MarR family transcriptional regulator